MGQITSSEGEHGRLWNRSFFLSYSTSEKELAHRYVSALEAQGLDLWFAPLDCVVGPDYPSQICRALLHCKGVILILSERAAVSPHVQSECVLASKLNLPILALRLIARSEADDWTERLRRIKSTTVSPAYFEKSPARLARDVRRWSRWANFSIDPLEPLRRARLNALKVKLSCDERLYAMEQHLAQSEARRAHYLVAIGLDETGVQQVQKRCMLRPVDPAAQPSDVAQRADVLVVILARPSQPGDRLEAILEACINARRRVIVCRRCPEPLSPSITYLLGTNHYLDAVGWEEEAFLDTLDKAAYSLELGSPTWAFSSNRVSMEELIRAASERPSALVGCTSVLMLVLVIYGFIWSSLAAPLWMVKVVSGWPASPARSAAILSLGLLVACPLIWILIQQLKLQRHRSRIQAEREPLA